MKVALNVNGTSYEVETEPRVTLADLLRDSIGLTGTHVGCEHGVCGACTVLLDGIPSRSCLIYAAQVAGASVVTVEGLADVNGALHPLQQAFSDNHALQCGFCTPGMLITALDLIDRNPCPQREEVRDEMSGNLCRCTGYRGIVDAVLDASRRLSPELSSPAADDATVED